MKPWLTRHPLASYFILTYAISWSIAVPLALQAQGIINTHLPAALHYLTMFGPALAALCMIGVRGDTLSGDRMRAPRSRRWKWWTIGFASPLAMFAAAQVVGRLAGQPTPTWTTLGHVNFLPDLGLFAWCLWFACSTGEEIGWRGFLLPRLQQRHSPLASSVLLAIGWAGWHLPAFFYLPSYSAIGLALLPGFFIGILSGAIVLTWFYNRSGGSVLAAA
jgi:membrane protease YdiL (CAAX protease family)